MTDSTGTGVPRQSRPVGLAARVLRFPLTRIFIAVPWLLACSLVPRVFHLKALFVSAPLGGAAVVAGYVIYVRLVENRPVSELAPRGALRELGAGLLLGATLSSVTIGAIWALGDYTVTGVNPWAAVLPAVVVALVSGTVEEIIFRGVIFRVAEEGIGTSRRRVCSGWRSRGTRSAAGLVSRLGGPAWVSGGAFGGEASLPAVVVCLVAGVYLTRRAARRGQLLPPAWRAGTPVPEPVAG